MEARQGSAEDLEAVRRLLCECELPDSDVTRDHLCSFYLLSECGAIIGSAGFEQFKEVALLRSVAIHPRWRGRGLGRRVVGGAERLARTRHVQRLYLLTTTAQSFFLGLGYTPVDRALVPRLVQATAEFRGLCPASAVCMTRTLSPGPVNEAEALQFTG